jgi:hypothetical protein
VRTNLLTREAIPAMCRTVPPHFPPYSPDKAPSDLHIFGPLKHILRRSPFWGRRRAETANSSRRLAYSVARIGVETVSIMKENLCKNNISFVKDVLMIYVDYIVIAG